MTKKVSEPKQSGLSACGHAQAGQMKMAFKKKNLNGQECWISGIYKIVSYGDYGYYAYFKPHKLKMWGNSCEYNSKMESKVYETLELAESACRKHLETFGSKPQPTDRI